MPMHIIDLDDSNPSSGDAHDPLTTVTWIIVPSVPSFTMSIRKYT